MDVWQLNGIYAAPWAPTSPFDLIDIRKSPYILSADDMRHRPLAVAAEGRDAGTKSAVPGRQKLTCRKRESFPDSCNCKSLQISFPHDLSMTRTRSVKKD